MSKSSEEKIKERYGRGTSKVNHDADCEWWTVEVCTCGLLHTLDPLDEKASELFPELLKQLTMHKDSLDILRHI